MELNPLTISMMLLLTELALTAVVGIQLYLFKQVTAARREHLELRIHIAQHYTQQEHFEKAIRRLESRFESFDTFFRNLNKRASA